MTTKQMKAVEALLIPQELLDEQFIMKNEDLPIEDDPASEVDEDDFSGASGSGKESANDPENDR